MRGFNFIKIFVLHFKLKCKIKNMKKFIILIVAAIILLIAASWWSKSAQSKNPDLLSKTGLHWHPELTIYVRGEKIEIPQNIGIGTVHMPIHTHDDLPLIHLEFQGLVRKQDITLGQFFKNWGSDIQSFGTNMRMIVNDQENTEFENYIMQDKDIIELRYE